MRCLSSLSMSTIHPDRPSIRTGSSDKIRRGVEERHWQLFEVRLKKPPLEQNRNPYTKSNDYRVIDRLNPTDHPQTPLEPRRRWQTFSSQLTDQSNETDRLTSLFRNVWLTNWRTKQTPSTPRPNSKSSGDAFLQRLSNNEKDRRVISSILHRHI